MGGGRRRRLSVCLLVVGGVEVFYSWEVTERRGKERGKEKKREEGRGRRKRKRKELVGGRGSALMMIRSIRSLVEEVSCHQRLWGPTLLRWDEQGVFSVVF